MVSPVGPKIISPPFGTVFTHPHARLQSSITQPPQPPQPQPQPPHSSHVSKQATPG